MRGTTVTICMILVIAALVPAASAGWKWRGTNEPDTLLDVQGGMMWPDADTVPVTDLNNEYRVYFNGFGHSGAVGMYNPNVGATGSRILPAPMYHFTAFFGVWKDCNGDGYIGSTEYGLLEYRAELLVDKSICPKQQDTGGVYPFNDGAWIREYIPMGDNYKNPNEKRVNPTVYVATGSRVWMDFNKPGDAPNTVCPTTGNMGFSSVGATLQWLDCFDGYQITKTLNSVQDTTGLPVGGWDHSDLKHSPNPLNIKNPAYPILYGDQDGTGKSGLFGQDRDPEGHSAPRAFSVWDCNASSPTPKPSTSVNPQGSVYEPANETYNIVTKGKCKSGNQGDNELPYPQLEGTSAPTTADRGRDSVDNNFNFNPGNRRLLGDRLGPNTPTDLGLGVDGTLDGTSGGTWRSNNLYSRAEGQTVNRANTANDPFTGGMYVTFYAYSGDTPGLTLPPNSGSALAYGSENCAGKTSGNWGGWNCDPADWEARCSLDAILASDCTVVGDPYNMLDVDCYDGTLVRGVPARASFADLSNSGVCQSPENLVVLELLE